jgi:hypothetical protein
MREFTEEQIKGWHAMVGKRVWKNPKTTSKFEPKPFKSGRKINTVKAVAVHDHTPNLAFVFEEDGSQVECWRCSLAPEGRYPDET